MMLAVALALAGMSPASSVVDPGSIRPCSASGGSSSLQINPINFTVEGAQKLYDEALYMHKGLLQTAGRTSLGAPFLRGPMACTADASYFAPLNMYCITARYGNVIRAFERGVALCSTMLPVPTTLSIRCSVERGGVGELSRVCSKPFVGLKLALGIVDGESACLWRVGQCCEHAHISSGLGG